MKRFMAIVMITLMLSACGRPQTLTTSDNKTKTYPTYGLLNEKTEKSDKVCYEISAGNLVMSILWVETVIAPVYFIGYSIYNPVSAKTADGKCAGIDN